MTHTRRITTFVLGLMIASSIASMSFGFGGDEKTPEEKAADAKTKAVKEYNAGVALMKRAKEAGAKSDSVFAFNYRATSDARAARDFEKAVERFEAAVKLDPTMHEAYNNMGYSLRKSGHFDRALVAYTSALKLKPDYAPAIEYRAEALLGLDSLGAAQTAVTTLQNLAKSDSANARLFQAYADTLGMAIERYQLGHFAKDSK